MKKNPPNLKSEIILNRGCYDNPHSGVGMEFDTLDLAPTDRKVVLHECGFLRDLESWMFPDTLSPFWRLYYNFSPGHEVLFEGMPLALAPDRMVLIPGGNLFDTRGTVPVDHFWLTFSLAYPPRKPGPVVLPVGEEWAGRIRGIADRFGKTGKGDRFSIYHGSLALLHDLMIPLQAELRKEPHSLHLAKAVSYIRERYRNQDLRIDEVAAAAGTSARTLSLHFQKELHCSPIQYIRKCRVSEVAGLLARSDLDLDRIAEATGFADRFYLSRVFKRQTGCPPIEYRRRHGPNRVAPESGTTSVSE